MTMKKLLALIMVLAMTVCLFAACAEKEEGPKDETADVRPLAEEALELFIKRDVKLYEKFTDPDPTVAPAKNVADKYTAYDALITNFEAQVDTWEIPDELKAEVKEYAKKKADDVYTKFQADGIQNVNVVGNVISASGKAKVLSITAKEYEYSYAELYTAPGNYAAFVGVDFGGKQPAKKLLSTATEDEIAANAAIKDACIAADAEAKEKIKVMTIDELKPVVDKIFEKAGSYVVDAAVSFQYKKNDKGEWKISNFMVSEAE